MAGTSGSKIPLTFGAVAVLLIGVNEGITWIVTPAIVIACLALLLVAVRGSGLRTRTVTAHIHSGSVRTAARHEAGHAAVLKKLGGRLIEARINPDGTGWVRGELPCRPTLRQAAVDGVAYTTAEGLRQGVNPWTNSQCRGDRAEAARILHMLPAGERGAVQREGERVARRHIHSGYAASVEATLLRKGRL